ncbi:MAG: ferredoxin reductase [Pseudomarimonas sp.]
MFTVNAQIAMNSLQVSVPIKRSSMRRLLSNPLLAPFNQPQAWDRLTTAISPNWSWAEPRAKVKRVVDEAPGVRSLWLKPNRRFGSFQPGQHVLLTLDIDGAQHSRCFSLSAAPRSDGLLRLTIRQQTDGPVSTAAHALIAGAVVRLSKAQGEFAPTESTRPLLLLCAGSGVTPMMSLLQAMATRPTKREVHVLHCGRCAETTIFADELRALKAAWPALNLNLHASGVDGRLDAASIAHHVPVWQECETLLCGPADFMQMVGAMYARAGISEQLQSESFGRRAATVDADAARHSVSTSETKQLFTALAGQSLLEAAEAAGLKPRFGCRRGICRTCQCSKRSGTVRNLLTGEISGPGEALIQLCISTPHSAVDLAI